MSPSSRQPTVHEIRHSPTNKTCIPEDPKLRRALNLFALILGTTAAACVRSPDLTSPNKHRAHDVVLDFPGNWAISSHDRQKGNVTAHILSIEGPGDALSMLTVFSPAVATTVEDYASMLAENRNAEVTGLVALGGKSLFTVTHPKRIAVETNIGGEPIQGLQEEFKLRVLTEDVCFVSTVFRVERHSRTAFLVSQSPADVWQQMNPGFKLIQRTFKLQPSSAESTPKL
jgi:hypothetical protein